MIHDLWKTWLSLPASLQAMIAGFVMTELVSLIRSLVGNRIDGPGVHRLVITVAALGAILNETAGLGIDTTGAVQTSSIWIEAALVAIGYNEFKKKRKAALMDSVLKLAQSKMEQSRMEQRAEQSTEVAG